HLRVKGCHKLLLHPLSLQAVTRHTYLRLGANALVRCCVPVSVAWSTSLPLAFAIRTRSLYVVAQLLPCHFSRTRFLPMALPLAGATGKGLGGFFAQPAGVGSAYGLGVRVGVGVTVGVLVGVGVGVGAISVGRETSMPGSPSRL